MDENEGLDGAARRELEEETGVKNRVLVQTGAYGGSELTVVLEVDISSVPFSYPLTFSLICLPSQLHYLNVAVQSMGARAILSG